MDIYDDDFEAREHFDDDDYDDERNELECVLGDECCMPFPHYADECYSAEDVIAQVAEWEKEDSVVK